MRHLCVDPISDINELKSQVFLREQRDYSHWTLGLILIKSPSPLTKDAVKGFMIERLQQGQMYLNN